jgi:hypothetical protein
VDAHMRGSLENKKSYKSRILCGLNRTCSEPHPSLKIGGNTVQKGCLFKNLCRKRQNRQVILVLPFYSKVYHSWFSEMSKMIIVMYPTFLL